MSNNEKFDAPDADVILQALGPPTRNFYVHKLLSLASPVFKRTFSLPRPTSQDSRKSTVAELEIVKITGSADALDIVLRMIYPFTPPSLDGDFDTLVECLDIAEKYDIKGVKPQLYTVLARMNATSPLRVYAAAARFGFANLMDSTSRHILSSVNLAGISELPDDFDFISATAYHKLVRQRASYLEAVVEEVKRAPLKPLCSDCSGGKYFAEEVFRLRLALLIITGTPVETGACFQAWLRAYGYNLKCENDCVATFIFSAVSRVSKGLTKTGASPPQKKVALKKVTT